MIKVAIILAFAIFTDAAPAAGRKDCLLEFGYNLFDRAYGLVYPDQPSPISARRATLARAIELKARLGEFKRMPHEYAKFKYALDQLDLLGVRLANMRRRGLRSSSEIREVNRTLDAFDEYHQFVDHALLRSFAGEGGRRLVDFELIPLTAEDDRYAREVLARAGLATREGMTAAPKPRPPELK